jgi:hypothetical protein
MLQRALRKLPSHFPAVGVAWGTILKHHRLEKAPNYQSVLLLLLLLLSIDLAPPGTA